MSNERTYHFPWGDRIVKSNGEVVEIRNREDTLCHSDDIPTAIEENGQDQDSGTEPVVSRYVHIPRDGEPWWSGLNATGVYSTI